MGVISKILFIILAFIILLLIVYFFLLFKLKNINNKIFRYKEEKNIKDQNVLVVYQPSRHKTTSKIANLICEKVKLKEGGF